MSTSSDAAEQVVRMSLEGTEVALKLTGSAAKNIAAAIYAVLKNKDTNKIKGRQRLTAMLKSGKALKVFTVSEEHLKQFAAEAKRYGVVYCALRGKEKSADGLVDIMVRAEDASKINRIVERFKLAAVDTVSIKSEIEKSKAEKQTAPSEPEQAHLEKGGENNPAKEPLREDERSSGNPSAAQTEKSPPSAPTSGKPGKAVEGTIKGADTRPSVRGELREIKAQREREEAAQPAKETEHSKKTVQRYPQHRQPPRKKKKWKER